MDRLRLIDILRRWALLLSLGPVVAGLTAFLVMREATPIYQTTVTLAVSQGTVGGGNAFEELRSSEQLVKTYVEVVRTRALLEAAAEKVGISLPFRDLLRNVSVRPVRDTQLLRITAEDADPYLAAEFANAVAQEFIARNAATQAGRFDRSRESLASLVDSLSADIKSRTRRLAEFRAQPTTPTDQDELARLQTEIAQLQISYGASLRSYEELRISEARSANSVTVLEPAAPPEEPVRPSRVLVVALASLAGLIVAIGLVTAATYLDDGLQTRQRVLAATGLATLGLIPEAQTGTRGTNGHGSADGRVAESFRLLMSHLRVAVGDRAIRSVLVTSALVAEGKSTTAANLAIVLAQSGRRVVLVDADLHRPTLAWHFRVPNRSGITTLLLNPDEIVANVVQRTEVPNLLLVTSGPPILDSSAQFSSQHFTERLKELHQFGDTVIFDTPPLLAQADAAILSNQMDSVVVVADAKRSRARSHRQAIEMLVGAGANVVGVVLNRAAVTELDYTTIEAYDPSSESGESGEPEAKLRGPITEAASQKQSA